MEVVPAESQIIGNDYLSEFVTPTAVHGGNVSQEEAAENWVVGLRNQMEARTRLRSVLDQTVGMRCKPSVITIDMVHIWYRHRGPERGPPKTPARRGVHRQRACQHQVKSIEPSRTGLLSSAVTPIAEWRRDALVACSSSEALQKRDQVRLLAGTGACRTRGPCCGCRAGACRGRRPEGPTEAGADACRARATRKRGHRAVVEIRRRRVEGGERRDPDPHHPHVQDVDAIAVLSDDRMTGMSIPRARRRGASRSGAAIRCRCPRPARRRARRPVRRRRRRRRTGTARSRSRRGGRSLGDRRDTSRSRRSRRTRSSGRAVPSDTSGSSFEEGGWT